MDLRRHPTIPIKNPNPATQINFKAEALTVLVQ